MNLNQILIHSTDTRKSVEFYQKLGLQLIVDSLPRYARLVCGDGGSTVSINYANSPLPTGAIKLYFECDDLDNTVAKLKTLGIEFDTEPVDQTWLWREAYLRDPSGNLVCLYFAGENRLNPPWRIKN